MVIKYILNGVKKEALRTNEDLEVSVIDENNRHIISVKAINKVMLLTAEDVYGFIIDKHDRYFLNGYQGWSKCHFIHPNITEKNVSSKLSNKFLDKYPVQMYGDGWFHQYRKNRIHSWELLYVQGNHELFIFNQNYQTAYLMIEPIRKKNFIKLVSDVGSYILNPGDTVTIFDFEVYESYEEGLKAFNKAFPQRKIEKIFGYTSWYNYYQNINEEIILRDLEGIDSRFNLFQIDDGFETYVGDWLDIDEKKFPNGLKPIVDKIHEKGLKAGIWLAPFEAEEKSMVFLSHPDWFLKNEQGVPLKVGVGWSGAYALDPTNKEVLAYVKKCLKYYMDLGFDFFKLDFLYSLNFTKIGITKSMISEKIYTFLQETLKGKTVLACGAVLPNVYQKFDYARVGMDATLIFDGPWYLRVNHPERPSTKNTLTNTIYRSLFNQRLFGNDPDVFILRNKNVKLSKKQKEALSTINALFGTVLMNSDNMSTYSPWAKQQLNKSLDLFHNAKNVSWSQTKNNVIHIKYELKDVQHEFDYFIKKGVIKNVR